MTEDYVRTRIRCHCEALLTQLELKSASDLLLERQAGSANGSANRVAVINNACFRVLRT